MLGLRDIVVGERQERARAGRARGHSPKPMNALILADPVTARLRSLVCLLSGLSVAAGPGLGAEPVAAPKPPPDFGELGFEQLAQIKVTTVGKREESLSRVAAAIHVITQDDIRRSGATSLPEVLRLAPGLQVARMDARRWAISSRGFNGEFANKLLVMVDGRTVYTPLFSGVHWHLVDPVLEDIDRIEVVRGPGATVWGANAVNGVINIITKSAKDTQGGLLTAGGGTEETAFGVVRYGLKLQDDAFLRLYAKGGTGDDTRLGSGAKSVDAWWHGVGGFRLDWTPTGADTVMVQGEFYAGISEQPTLPAFPYDPVRNHGGFALARWTRELADDSRTSLQFFYDRRVRDTQGFKEDRDQYDVEFQHQLGLGTRNNLVWGGGYRLNLDRLEPGTATFLPAEEEVHQFNLFLQDTLTLVPERLTFTPGVKLELHEYTGLEVQPGARLAWTPHAHHTFWASVARAVRTPSRADETFQIPAVSLPNTALSSERLTAYELGYRTQPHPQLTLDTALFYNDYDRLRSTERPFLPATTPTVRGSLLRGETYGVEGIAAWQATEQWRLTASYTYLNMQLHLDPGSTAAAAGAAAPERQSPRHQAALRSRLDLSSNVEFDTAFRYVDSLPGLAPGIPAYWTTDVRLAWRPRKEVELSVVGQNLAARSHPEFTTGNAGPLPREIERSVYGKITWRF